MFGRNDKDDPRPAIYLDFASNVNCTKPNNLIAPSHPMGGLLDNQHIVYCGGAHSAASTDTYEPGCFKMYETQSFQQLIERRYRGAAIVLDDSTLWVTGGL